MYKQERQKSSVRGQIEKLYFSGPQFSAGCLRSASGEKIQFAGNLFAKENQQVVLHGDWINHPKFGRQFKVEGHVYDLDLNTDGLVNYLANHPEIKGIGPVKARMIVDKFGRDFENVLVNTPERIAKVAGVSLDSIRCLQAEWQKNRHLNSVMSWLSAFELTHHQVTVLVDKYGAGCLEILKSDPYLLIKDVKNFGFRRVDQIACKMGTPKDHPSRIRAGLMFCMQEALEQGDCWVEFEDLLSAANLLLVMDVLDSKQIIEKELDWLIDAKQLRCHGFCSRLVVALPYILQMEKDLLETFGLAKMVNPHFSELKNPDKEIIAHANTLNEKQLEAVLYAAKYSISLISGGAGSGKSYTIGMIESFCRKFDLKVILAAPTGKAAKRLEEISAQSATTIHRLLGYNGRTFAKNQENKIEANILIVDEFSMVDTPLAWHLFQAIDLNSTAVVLVGDHNQLPPVGPGNILRDLINTKAIPTVILDKVVRQAGALKENCTAILKGDVAPTSPANENKYREWYVVDQFTNQLAARDAILELFKSKLDELGFDIIRDVQVLTPTHKGILGTKALNEDLQCLIQKKLWQNDVLPITPGRRPPFYKHDKVIQTRNNYDLNIMNGAIGQIEDVLSNGSLQINFDGQIIAIEKNSENLNDLQLAYALSVHKTQGSEFPCAIVIIHKVHSFMHHRNLLYTGVTRARKSAIVIGDHWGIHNCAQKTQADNRKTFLAVMLSEIKPSS